MRASLKSRSNAGLCLDLRNGKLDIGQAGAGLLFVQMVKDKLAENSTI